MRKRYCEMCDKWVPAKQTTCRECGASTVQAGKYCAACDREGATAGGDTTPLEYHTCQRKR
jgi:RNA polymerase subunit RPABC4/transcription elongation factor Spt4